MQSSTDGAEGAHSKRNPFFTVLKYMIVVVAVLIGEPTMKLFRDTYSRNESIIPTIIGALLALGAGIAMGHYYATFLHAGVLSWSLHGVLAAAGTFFFGWPILYVGPFQKMMHWSELLWRHVNIDGRWSSKNPAWFTSFLLAISWLAIVLFSLALGVKVAMLVQANQATWGWLGVTIGVIACIALVIAAAILLFILADWSWLWLVAAAVLVFFFWSPLSGFFIGAFHALKGEDWGNWGYLPGGVVGTICALIAGSCAGGLLNTFRIGLLAVGFGIAATYFSMPLVAAMVHPFIPSSLVGFTPVFEWAGHLTALYVYIGFLIPILHILITHSFKFIADLRGLWRRTYRDDSSYAEFFAQLSSILLLCAMIHYSPIVIGWLGLTNLWLIGALLVAVALAAYMYLGHALTETGIFPLALVGSIWTGGYAFLAYAASGLPFGLPGAVAAGGLSALLQMAIGIPVIYSVLKFILNPLLASWLPLVSVHRAVVKGFFRIIDQLVEASEQTYGDNTPYRELFLHVINIVVAGGAGYGAFLLTTTFAPWLMWSLIFMGALLSYFLIGKVLLKFGNWLVGFCVSAYVAIIAGKFAYEAQPYGLWVAIPVGLVAGAINFGATFPVPYVVVRAIVNLFSPEKWLTPILCGIFNSFLSFFSSAWTEFKEAYVAVRNELGPLWDDVVKTYEEVSVSIRSHFKS